MSASELWADPPIGEVSMMLHATATSRSPRPMPVLRIAQLLAVLSGTRLTAQTAQPNRATVTRLPGNFGARWVKEIRIALRLDPGRPLSSALDPTHPGPFGSCSPALACRTNSDRDPPFTRTMRFLVGRTLLNQLNSPSFTCNRPNSRQFSRSAAQQLSMLGGQTGNSG
jgi:hypothetical protein